ncbi:hypothetical protein IMZ48_33380 [Candidatus Bathyarchaeota archaeon]|nr:hypothetical protein [Candidatus Bathyarchaeota archaeon]
MVTPARNTIPSRAPLRPVAASPSQRCLLAVDIMSSPSFAVLSAFT